MRVLVACEESQEVCKAFRALGHEAYSCDIEPCSGGHPEWHIQVDALELLKMEWDLIIAHPPCTYMSKAGACRMYLKPGIINQERFKKAMLARDFFMRFYNCDCPKIVIENPTPLRCIELPKATQIIQPYEFGEPYSKRTLLWIKGLEPLTPTKILQEFEPYVPSNTSKFSKGAKGAAGVARGKARSKTFPGIARAMAEQWGGKCDA